MVENLLMPIIMLIIFVLQCSAVEFYVLFIIICLCWHCVYTHNDTKSWNQILAFDEGKANLKLYWSD